MSESDDLIPVTVKGLIPTPSGSGVFLANQEKVIAIFVDSNVAAAITMFMQKLKKPRPLTHDLIGNAFRGLGITVQKVVVNDLREETFYARLFLLQTSELGTNLVEIDSRPSDAIALALQQGCPIYVASEVWNQAENMSWALKKATGQMQGIPDEEDNDDEIDISQSDAEAIEKLLKGLPPLEDTADNDDNDDNTPDEDAGGNGNDDDGNGETT